MSKYAGKLITLGSMAGNSVQFPGATTSYLETPWNAVLTFGAGDWTIEAWVYPTTTATQVAIISNWTATAGQFQLHRTAGNRLEIIYNLNGTTTTLTGTQFFILPNTWTHVCVMRTGGGLYMLVNGVQDTTASVSTTAITGTGQVVRVGVEAATVNPFIGFISNARIVVGTAVYSVSSFRVPMILDPSVSGTQYLTCASGLFIDLSANNFTVTRAGTVPTIPQISTFTPYGGASPLTSNPALGTGPAGVYRSSDMATYSVTRATAAYDPYFPNVKTLLHGAGWNNTSNRAYSALQNFNYTAATSTASTISGGNTLTIGGTVAGTFAVGMPITGTGVRDGTVIVAYGTGTGGAGTYYVSGANQTVTSTAINGVDGGYITTPTTLSTGNTGFVAQGSFSPFYSTAGWSFYNNNTTASYLETSTSPNFTFGAGDYTIEFWIMAPVVISGRWLLDFRTGGTLTGPAVLIDGSQRLSLNGIAVTSVAAITQGRWYHVAICRAGATTRMFVDGVLTQSATPIAFNTTGDNTLRVAANNDLATANLFTRVYMSNLRIIKGQALYSGPFKPSMSKLNATSVGATGAGAAIAITGTVALLALQDSRFIDNSGNNVTITPVGNTSTNFASTTPHGPFYRTAPYSPGSAGGSIYFSGSSSYLTVAGANANCAFGTGDFTIECWIYPLSIAAVQLFFDTMGGTTTGRLTLQYETDQSVSVTYNAGANFLTSTAGCAPIATWTHVYLGRVSGTSYLFINGVQKSTTTTSPAFICDANRPVLGTNGSSLGSNSFTGYISGLRITRVSLGTTTVPTVPPQMVEYTALLMNGADSAIDDSSANNNYVTAGSTSVSASALPPNRLTSNILFNGTTDFLQSTDPNILNPNGDFTVEAWIYSTSFAAAQTIFQINGNNNSYAACRLDITTSGTLQLLVSTTGAAHVINVTSSLTILTSTWTHIAVVRSGGTVYLFVNGRLYTSSTALAAATATMTPTFSRIGAQLTANGTSNTQFFVGRMSDIRITQAARYNVAGFQLPTSMFQDM